MTPLDVFASGRQPATLRVRGLEWANTIVQLTRGYEAGVLLVNGLERTNGLRRTSMAHITSFALRKRETLNSLLQLTIDAHGDFDRWQRLESVAARLRSGGEGRLHKYEGIDDTFVRLIRRSRVWFHTLEEVTK